MKIAVSSLGETLDSQVDPRFGRCQYIIIFDTDTGNFESFKNENVMAQGGAGVQTSMFAADKGAQVVLTGSLGPNAVRTLHAAGIKTYGNVSGTVQKSIDDYKAGKLPEITSPTSPGYHGSR